jgi:dipeptidyl-peptidase-4
MQQPTRTGRSPFFFSFHTLQLLLTGLLLSIPAGLYAQTGKKQFTQEDIVSEKFKPDRSAFDQFRSLPDGEHYSMLSNDRSAILKYACKTGQVVDTLFNAKQAGGECRIETIDDYLVSATGFRIIILTRTERLYRYSLQADVYDYNVRRNLLKPLSDLPGKLRLPTFSPDGRMCAFVRENNIWLKKFDYDTESQVTKDGRAGSILNGSSDWVYEEEFAVVNLMSWSPDSKTLAFIRLDETNVATFGFQLFDGALYPALKQYKYPKAGETNASVSVHAYDVDTKDIKKMDLPVAPDDYIPAIQFTRQPDRLAVVALNRQQNILKMYYANPRSTVCRLILKDENPSYIDHQHLNSIRFTENNFTCISESDGYAHIYLYSPTGILQKQLTSGSWDVTALLGVDATGTVYYESAEESPLRRAAYSIDAKGRKTKLTARRGFNRVRFNDHCTYYICDHSAAGTPNRISIHNRDGKELAVLQDSRPLQTLLDGYEFAPKEFFTIDCREGHELNAWMVKPQGFNPARQYPAVMLPYGGPGSQRVLDRFEIQWEQYLSAQGFVVVCVDGRGTGARGEAFRKCSYLKLGIAESDDQTEAAQWIGRLPFVDRNRIGIWGWSYGGTLTLLSMSRGNGTFKAGIAIAPVTDWKLYSTIYTERYMRTPNENFDGYAATAPITYADRLQGKLLLIHGTSDDNVHLQHTLHYAGALVEAGKPFDMQIYPNKNHSIPGEKTRRHLYAKCCTFLKENL